MARIQALSASVVGSTNGSGSGTLSVGPSTPGTIWYPQSVSFSMTGSFPTVTGSNIPLVQIYIGSTNASSLIDSTYNVLQNSSSMISGQVVYPGTLIYAVWQYGNDNAAITFNVYGKRQVP